MVKYNYYMKNMRRIFHMDEKVYKTIGLSGAANLAIGICILVTGVASGILLILNGAKLLKSKKQILL